MRQNQVVGRVKFKGEQPAGLRQNERAAVRIVLDERDNVLKFERGSFIDEATRAVYVVHGAHARAHAGAARRRLGHRDRGAARPQPR